MMLPLKLRFGTALVTGVCLCLLSLTTRADDDRYKKVFIPLGGDKVLFDKEFIVGPEKVFMTFFTSKQEWNSLPVVDLSKETSFTFGYEDAFQSALKMSLPEPRTKEKTPLSTELLEIERVVVVEDFNDLKHPRGRYYYFVHILNVFPPPPGPDSIEQPVGAYVLVLPNGKASWPISQSSRVQTVEK